MQDREEVKQLFERYRKGRCTPEEQARLHAWFNEYARHEAGGLDELRKTFETDKIRLPRRRFFWFSYAAAAIAIVALGGTWLLLGGRKQTQGTEVVVKDIAPGGNRAMLTLADGRMVDLSETQERIIVGEEITYSDGSPVLGKEIHTPTSSLTLTTPRGGTYEITLSDGTQVWLNSASTLKYPSHFGSDERVVEIDGEGYFSIVKDKQRPFRVISKDQKIDVLGTEFNISAYEDDLAVTTTLIEGAVRIVNLKSEIANRLDPGEQSVVQEAVTDIQHVGTEPYIAWKNGDFYFDNTPLVNVMKQIARWYDVEVVYERGVPQENFSGTMSRNVTLQTVLELLRISEIKYRIENNQLFIE